jgi:hypothetical protein
MNQLKTVNIKGKEYVMVNERLKHFRTCTEYKGWSIESELKILNDQSCIVKAIIKNEEGRIISTGHAHETKGKGVNATSHVENCESSAWGRALGALNIGIDSSIASYEEVKNAQASLPFDKNNRIGNSVNQGQNNGQQNIQQTPTAYRRTQNYNNPAQ